jgi:hypothetical protein
MGRRKKRSLELRRIKVTVADRIEVFILKKELLIHREEEMARARMLQDAAALVLRHARQTQKEELSNALIPLSPDSSIFQSSMDSPEAFLLGVGIKTEQDVPHISSTASWFGEDMK